MAMGYYFVNSSRGSKESIGRGNALLKEGKDEILAMLKYETDLIDNSFAVVADRNNAIYNSTANYRPTFEEDNPLKWSVDPDKLQDIGDSRV
jgi:hypothetical protein